MDKQTEILATALNLFVEYGFHGTPTSKIAKEAGVANGTLFHYYKTKDELIVALYLDIKKKMMACADLQFSEEDTLKFKFKFIYVSTMLWGLENPSEFKYLQQFINSPFMALIPREVQQQMSSFLIDLVENGIKQKIVKPLPIDYLMVLVSSHLFGINQYLISSQFDSDKQKTIINDSFELLWNMIA